MKSIQLLAGFVCCLAGVLCGAEREHKAFFEPFTWPSEPPSDCPFPASTEITGIRFTGNTCARMHTYILESSEITGPWKLVTYMKNFGEQCYFATFPSKFISADGRTAYLCYSANFATDWNGEKIQSRPPGSHYGLVLQEVKLLGR